MDTQAPGVARTRSGCGAVKRNAAPAERVFIALGANLGDPRRQLDAAIAALAHTERVVGCSTWHTTTPVGGPPGQPDYLNGVVEVRSDREPEELLSRLQQLEQRFGRVRGEPNGPRTLDLDLLIFGDRRIATTTLELPHPRMEERLFVLAPLAEIAPELVLRNGRSAALQLQHLRRMANLAPSRVDPTG